MELRHIIAVGEPRATILILHGYAEHSGRYSSLIEVFARAGYDVFIYDQRAHGKTDEPPARVDVAELIWSHRRARQLVRERMRTGRLILFGHSMGGLVTSSSSLIDPSGIDAVILSGPAFRQYPEVPGTAARLGYRIAGLLPGLPTAKISPSLISRDPVVVRDYERDPLVYFGRVPLLTGASMAVHGRRALEHAHRWPNDLPLLVVHGDADGLAQLAGAREFVDTARSAGAPADLVVAPGGYHEVLKDLGHEALEERILTWLDIHAGSKRALP